MTDSGQPAPRSEFLLYSTEDGRTRLTVRFDGETVWLTQPQLGELGDEATVKRYLTVGSGVARGRSGPRHSNHLSDALRGRDAIRTCKQRLQVGHAHRRQLPTPVTPP